MNTALMSATLTKCRYSLRFIYDFNTENDLLCYLTGTATIYILSYSPALLSMYLFTNYSDPILLLSSYTNKGSLSYLFNETNT